MRLRNFGILGLGDWIVFIWGGSLLFTTVFHHPSLMLKLFPVAFALNAIFDYFFNGPEPAEGVRSPWKDDAVRLREEKRAEKAKKRALKEEEKARKKADKIRIREYWG